MTREEAIEDLLRHYTGESTDMAIEALSIEFCDDAVSRDYLLNIANADGAYGYVSAYDIGQAPPVIPKQKMGHWICHHEPYTWLGWTTWSCSKCNFYTDSSTANYCPNCGVKMIKSEEEE